MAHEHTSSTIMAGDDKKDEQAAQLKKLRRKLAWALVPKIPLLIRLFFSRILGISETARYLNLETDITLTILRATLNDPKPHSIIEIQAMTLLDPGVKGKVWISNAVCDVPPERGIREALIGVIRSMSDSEEQAASLRVPDIVPVEAEWTGYRAGATENEPLPAISEEQKYEALMKECNNTTTVLYFHGGAYYLCDPSTHRPLATRLAKEIGGRVYSVRYRLAPQHPFPAALLDALVSYFTLLYPPPGSIHEAVSPRDIVLGGDSAGGNLAIALTRTLMQLHHQDARIAWFGLKRRVPLPAGVTVLSPWLDMTQSMPSWSTNRKWDFLPSPADRGGAKHEHTPDAAWPASPPRQHLYVDDALRLHPLVSTHLSHPLPRRRRHRRNSSSIGSNSIRSSRSRNGVSNGNINGSGSSGNWTGAPPFWVACGWECLADEARYLVARLRADGVRVVFEEYEAMPHAFAQVVPKTAEAARCVQGWARFVTATRKDPLGIASSYTLVRARTLAESEGDAEALTPYDEEGVWELARAKLEREASNMVISPGI